MPSVATQVAQSRPRGALSGRHSRCCLWWSCIHAPRCGTRPSPSFKLEGWVFQDAFTCPGDSFCDELKRDDIDHRGVNRGQVRYCRHGND